MSTEKLEEIKKQVKSLAGKKSWVKKSFKELLKKINDELKDDLEKAGIKYWKTIADFHYDNQNDYFYPDCEGEKTVFCVNKYGKIGITCFKYRGEWEHGFDLNINKMKIVNIRKALEELPSFLTDLLEYTKAQNKNVKEAKQKVQKVLEKF